MTEIAREFAGRIVHAEGQPSRSAVIFGAGIGNALEWYDFAVYAIFAPYFAAQFFHTMDEKAALLSTLAVFAVGFVLRPIGGMYFGWLADRRGRKHAMVVSMIVTAMGCAIIMVAPIYEQVGLLAPLLLMLGRFAQGFGLGGEIGASFTFLVESAPPARRGLWSSSMFIAINVGALAATVVGLVLTGIFTKEQMVAFGWRIPFGIGALLGLYALSLRRKLPETHAFEREETAVAQGGTSVLRGVWEHRTAALQVIGLTAGPTICYNTWISGATNYAIAFKGTPASASLQALALACLVFIAVQPFWGMFSDRFGRKPGLMIGAGGSALLAYPLIHLIQGEVWQLCVAIAAAMAILAAWTSIGPAVYAEMFPTNIRASGVAIPYSISVALFGGTAPYIQAWLANAGRMDVFIGYVVFLNVVTVITVLFMAETKGRPLT